MTATATPAPKAIREKGPKAKPRAAAAAQPADQAVRFVDLSSIDIGENVRKEIPDAEIETLAASIKVRGVLQPVKLLEAGGRFTVVWGQRRVLAARRAELERVPAIVVDVMPPADQLAIEQLVENLHREDLNPVDRARAMRQVVTAGMSQADLARELGLHPSTIANDLGMLDAPPAVMSLLADGTISPAHQRAMKGLDPKAQEKLAREAAQGNWSAHRTEEEVQRRKRDAEYQAEQQRQRAKDNAAQKAQLEASIAEGFPKKKVPTDALIIVTTDRGDAGHLVSLIKAGGYANTRVASSWNEVEARPSGGLCDCTAWKASIHYRYGEWKNGRNEVTYSVTISKGCIVPKHQQAKRQVAETKRLAGEELGRRVRDHVVATSSYAHVLEGARAAAVGLNPDATLIAIPRILAEAILWDVLQYSLPRWAEARGGSPTKPWGTLHALSDEELAKELGSRVAGDFRDKAGYHVDWAALAAELGLVDAPTGWTPNVGDPIVVDGTKYKVTSVTSVATSNRLAIVTGKARGVKGEIVATVHDWDKVAGVYRGQEQPGSDLAAVAKAAVEPEPKRPPKAGAHPAAGEPFYLSSTTFAIAGIAPFGDTDIEVAWLSREGLAAMAIPTSDLRRKDDGWTWNGGTLDALVELNQQLENGAAVGAFAAAVSGEAAVS